jgi:two-component sensor histidine kinase
MSDEIDPENTETLGLQLVTTLAEQLDGTLSLNRNGGTAISVTFPVP